jgi:6-phosphogluconolactonase (cycloisomerase 2 family)
MDPPRQGHTDNQKGERMTKNSAGAVYVQTNAPQNRVVAFQRAADGSLARGATYATDGAGTGVPHLTSQGSVVLTGDGRQLLVVNAASDEVSLFAVAPDAALTLVGRTSVGSTPKSIAEHDGLVYVLNAGAPSLTGYRRSDQGLAPIAGAAYPLPADADPAQVGFAPTGQTLIVTARGPNAIVAFPAATDGRLGAPTRIASSGPTPYGFTITAEGILVVTEAFGAQPGKAAASSYVLDGTAVRPVTASLGNGRSEICWAVAAGDGRTVFATNFADGAVSRYAVARDGALTLADATAGITVDGRPGLRDAALTPDGQLYAIDADAGAIVGWSVGPDGALTAIGSWGGLPPTIAGLAAS